MAKLIASTQSTEGQRLFAAYKQAAEALRLMAWGTDREWQVAEARVATAEKALATFLGGL